MVDLTEGRGRQVMDELRAHALTLQDHGHNKYNCNSCWTLWALEDQRSEIDFARQLAIGVYPDELANQFGGMGLEDRPLGVAIANLHLKIEKLEKGTLRKQLQGYQQALEGIKKAHFGKIRGWNDRFICVRCNEPFPCPDFEIADSVLAGKEAQG